MRPLTIKEIREAVSGKIIQGDPSSSFKNISIDSRTLHPGDLFFAIIGERFDGHRFIDDAVKNGAKALVVDRTIKSYPGIAIILVENTTTALQELAHYYRKKLIDIKVVGVTGSAGKTTTKDMIAGILSQQYKISKTRGNLNNYYGLPLTILSLTGEEEAVVLEMGMSNLGEIGLLTRIAVPDIGVITNVGPTHLENLQTVANVARGKKELIEGLGDHGIAVLNYDNQYVREMDDSFQGEKIVFYGLDLAADIYADNISTDDQNKTISFDVNYHQERQRIELNKPGRHNIYNALAAIAVAREYGIEWDKIRTGLNNFDLSSLRLDIREIRGVTVINDTYNANPLSMRAGIGALMDIARGRTITVLGDMLELGPQEEDAHYSLGEYIMEMEIDILVTVGELGRIVASGALESGMAPQQIFSFKGNQKAGQLLLEIMQEGDTVLIKGSRGLQMEQIVEIVLKQGG